MTAEEESAPKVVSLPEMTPDLTIIANLQEWISDLNDSNVTETVAKIMKTTIPRNAELSAKMAIEVLRIVPLRPKNLDVFVQFCKQIFEKIANGNQLIMFKQRLLGLALDKSEDFDIHGMVPGLFFTKKLATANVITPGDISFRLQKINSETPNRYFLSICYFVFELEKTSKDLFKRMMEEVKNIKITDPLLVKFQQDWDDLVADSHKKLDELTQIGYLTNSMEYAVYDDDLDAFLEFTNDSSFRINKQFDESPWVPCTFLHWNPAIIDFAAFYGSLRVMRWLLENRSKRSFITMYATAGGAQEALDLCGSYQISFSSCLRIAAAFRLRHIYDYVARRTKPKYLVKELNLALCRAAGAGDLNFVISCLRSGAKINYADENGETALNLAVKADNEAVARYILMMPNVKREKTDLWGKTPLDNAHSKEMRNILTANNE